MADIDLDALEEIMKKEKEKAREQDRKSRSKRRSKSRSRSRSHSRRHHRHRHSHSKSHHKRSRSRTKHSSKDKDLPEDPVLRQQVLLERQIEEARQQAEEAQRDDCTVLVQRIHLNADERDLYKLFATVNVGKVRDVQIVRDPRSGKSKGVGYVEFYSPESVLMAMTLTGTKLMGQEIVVQASQAEKNRAAAAAKYKKEMQEKSKPGEPSEGPMRIAIEGFAELLEGMTENDLYKLFSPFGAIEYIDLPRGQEDGLAYVQFKKTKDAREAIRKMNNIKFRGKTLKVAVSNEGLKPSRAGEYIPSTELEAEERGKMIDRLESRQALMQKLTRDEKLPSFPISMPITTSEPTHCLLLSNLFDPAQVDLTKDPTFFLDVKEDVMEACSECGQVEMIWMDQTSNGNAWVKYANRDVNAAKRAMDKLNGRFFAGRTVSVSYVPENVLNAKAGIQNK